MRSQIYPAAQWLADGDHLERTNGHRIFYRDRGSGPAILLLHGFPTWSYDYADVALDLEKNYRVITPDFLGYGGSDKPKGHDFTVEESADIMEELAGHLGINSVCLVLHDYGGIVGQELLDRSWNGNLMIKIDSLVLLNFAIAYEAYRPVLKQKLLNLPIIGSLVATLITKQRLFKGINSARGANKLSAAEFEALWSGISRENGQKLSHRHIRYNRERNAHARRWETALFAYRGPTKLVWGLADPVSGEHVLKLARPKFKHLSKDDFLELPDVGHFPQSEASAVVAQAIRSVAS